MNQQTEHNKRILIFVIGKAFVMFLIFFLLWSEGISQVQKPNIMVIISPGISIPVNPNFRSISKTGDLFKHGNLLSVTIAYIRNTVLSYRLEYEYAYCDLENTNSQFIKTHTVSPEIVVGNTCACHKLRLFLFAAPIAFRRLYPSSGGNRSNVLSKAGGEVSYFLGRTIGLIADANGSIVWAGEDTDFKTELGLKVGISIRFHI